MSHLANVVLYFNKLLPPQAICDVRMSAIVQRYLILVCVTNWNFANKTVRVPQPNYALQNARGSNRGFIPNDMRSGRNQVAIDSLS